MWNRLLISLILIASGGIPAHVHGAQHSIIRIRCPNINLCYADVNLDIGVDVNDTLLQIRINDSLLQISIDSLKQKIEEAMQGIKEAVEVINKEALKEALERTQKSLKELEKSFSWSSSFGYEVKRAIDKKVKIKRGTTVSIKNKFGDIEVIPTNTDEVKIHAEIEVGANTEEEAQEYAQKIEIKAEVVGSELKIATIYPERDKVLKNLSGRYRFQHQVNLKISVPRFAPVQIDNSFGDIEVNDLKQPLSVGGKFGDVYVMGCEKIQINNSHGDVDVKYAKDTLLIENHFGGVVVKDAHGPVTVDNSHGGVEVRNAKQGTRIYNKYGSVELSDIRGYCEVRNSHGSVKLSDVDVVDVINRYGSITIKNASDEVDVQNAHGSVTIELYESPIPEISACTSFQPIELILPDNVACKILAETSYGSIESDFPLDVERSRYTTTASGTINHGKTRVDLETKHSNIYIRKR